MFGLLRRRTIALLWIGGLISLIGDWILLTALPYYVYQLTTSLFATAAMTVIQLVPGVPLSSVAGVLVDRWDRKATMLVCNLLQGWIVLLLLFVHSTAGLWAVYVTVFVQAIAGIFVAPASHALLPCLVEEENLASANSLFGLNTQLARLLGPPPGGALVGWFGIDPVFILDSGSFLVVAVMLACVVVPSFSDQNKRSVAGARSVRLFKKGWVDFWHEWMQGWKLIWERPLLLTLMFVLGVTTFEGSRSSLCLFNLRFIHFMALKSVQSNFWRETALPWR